MAFNKKYIAAIATVAVIAAYSISRWQGSSDDDDGQLSVPEHQSSADS